MPERAFGRGAAILIVFVAILLMTTLVGARVLTAMISDKRVAEREEALVRHGIEGWIQEVAARVVPQTTWDAAVQGLGVRFDHEWADENIGKYLHDLGGFERSFVLDRQDRLIYAMEGGRDAAFSSYEPIRGVATSLIARVRAREPQVPPKTSTPPPIQASDVAWVYGEPAIITATLVQSDFGRARLVGRSPLVVTVMPLDERFEQTFANRFLLEAFHIHPGLYAFDEPGEASMALTDSAGKLVARMDWQPQRPARALLKKSLPAVLLAMAIFSLITAAIFLRGRTAARALIASESHSKHMAYHDHLTGLPNRALLSEHLSQQLLSRKDQRSVGVLVLDIDRFKEVNDTHGHAAGDEVIVRVAARLKALLGERGMVARLGGDEFAIIVCGADRADLIKLASDIVVDVGDPCDLSFGRLYPSASVGVAEISDTWADAIEALRRADVALYRAKEAGRDRFQVYDAEMDAAIQARRALEADLRTALREDQLTMVYQPQVQGDSKVVGVEALVRWRHPMKGPISPSQFVPLAEECGLIDALGEFTVRRAMLDSRLWPHLTVGINISPVQLRGADFVDRVAALVAETGANPARIELEITESILLEHDQRITRTLARLREMGFSLALDDFGTGYSSLAYLRRYPVDRIKIDRSFITNLGAETASEAVVAAIVNLARALSLDVIAEGVETEMQRLGLRRAGCSQIQGFLYAEPMSAPDVDDYILGFGAVRPQRARR